MKWCGHIETDRVDYQGGGDAAVETFTSDPNNSLIRESFQNSVDQWSDKSKPVKIKIKYNLLSKKDLPDYDNLEKILKLMRKNARDEKDESAISIFNNIFKDLNGQKVATLEIADYNTKGAPGKDIKEKNDNNSWIALTRREGYSVKPDSSSIGAFGIGKNALVNISNMRTVIYSTKAENEDKWKLIGKCKLIHWYDEKNKYHKNKIYFGKINEDEDIISISNSEKNKINEAFYRKEYGTSQHIILPNMPEKWKDQYTSTILRNYWLMIEKNQLAVEIHSLGELIIEINRENIKEMMEKTFEEYNTKEIKRDHPLYGNPLEFYRVYKNTKPLTKNIDHIGKIELYFKSFGNEENIPPTAKQKRVSYVRGNMLIQNKIIRGEGDFIGIMMCKNDKGNEILKKMEPPKHDKFEYNNLNNKDVNDIKGKKVTKEIGKNILDQISKFIREVAEKEENKRLSTENHELLGLDEWNIELGDNEAENNKETSRRIIKDITIKKPKKIKLIPEFGGEEKARKVLGDDPNIKPEPGPKPGPKPDPNPKPGKLVKDENGEYIIPKNYFKSKSFISKSEKNSNRYKIIINEDRDNKTLDQKSLRCSITIKQNGDNSTSCAFKLEKAFYEDNNKTIDFNPIEKNDSTIKGYQINKILLPTAFYIDIKEPYKSNFNFSIKTN